MASSNQLKQGYFGPSIPIRAEWLKHNHLVNRQVKTLQNSHKNGCRFFSVCYSAPIKGWSKSHYGCRAHIKLIGPSLDDVKVASVELNHTCVPEDSQRKRGYRMGEIANLSEAVALYQPTCRREGNAKQLTGIAKASTGFDLSRSQAYRSIHKRAMDTIHAQIGQYMLLPDLFRELKEQDAEGSHLLESHNCPWDEEKQQFHRCYIALSCMKHFWSKAIIKMIVIDGTHTKLSDFKHIILLAVTFDGNNEIVILSFAIVDVENKDNWVWFHEKLKTDFPGFECLMCDADKGITSQDFQLSQEEVEAVTSRCARHLAENCREANKYTMNNTHKDLILSLAKARTEESYLDVLEKIRAIHSEWAEWLHDRRNEFATYVFLRDHIRRWGKVTSNAVENINSSLLDIRSLPILYLIMGIVEKTQAKYVSGYRKAIDLQKKGIEVTDYAWTHHKLLVKEAMKRKVFVTQEREDFFCGKVSTGRNSQYQRYVEVSVEPSTQESHCPCMFYQELGMRCHHIIALLRKNGQHVQDKWWFSKRYHTSTYLACYSASVPTLALRKLQPDLFFTPPEYKKSAGRPAKLRKDRSHLNKTSKLNQCSSCGGLGHSYRTCKTPCTQFRFENHFAKAVEWTKNFSDEQTD